MVMTQSCRNPGDTVRSWIRVECDDAKGEPVAGWCMTAARGGRQARWHTHVGLVSSHDCWPVLDYYWKRNR